MKLIRSKWRFLVVLSFALLMIGIINTPVKATGINSVPIALDDVWISGDISVKDEVDFYYVTIPSAGWLTVDYQGFSVRDSYIQILNNDLTKSYAQHEIYYSSSISPITKEIVLAMEPGTYQIKIWSVGSNVGDYRLKSRFAPAKNNETIDNNEFNTAMSLSEKKLVTGFISEDDTVDFYKIYLPKAKTLNIFYTAYIRDSYIQVWDSDYKEISKREVYYASETAPLTYVYEQFLEPGVYYVKIYPAGSNRGRYTIKWETKQYVQQIKLNKSKLVLDKKNTYKLTANVLPKDANNKKLQWTSSNIDVATVDKNGKIKAKRAGSATITATSTDGANIKASCFVVVKPEKIKVTAKRHNYDQRKLYITVKDISGESGYQYMWSKSSNFKKKKSYSTSSTYMYTDRLAKNTTYYVKVRAYYSDGTTKYYGPWSNVKTIRTKK